MTEGKKKKKWVKAAVSKADDDIHKRKSSKEMRKKMYGLKGAKS